MHAIVVTQPGGPDVLCWTEVPDPVPGPGEVLVDVVASGVNRADTLQRQGFYPPPPGAPPYPGLECSGRIAVVGQDVTGWKAGDEVCALLSGGGYAEKVAVPAGQLLPVPEGIRLVAAAALPEVTCTVYANVFMLAGLRPGETLLVHGGASGIGTMAIQLGRAHGARVACTAGSPEKLARCRELGADLAISYRDEDFVAAVKDFARGNGSDTGPGSGPDSGPGAGTSASAGPGADVILDIMGASYLSRNVHALATSGRLAVIGLQGGTRAELDLGELMRKRASVHATSLRSRPKEEKAVIVAAVREHVWPLLASGEVVPVIDHIVPMAKAADAHAAVEAGTHIGKILLVAGA
jgi:NADPH:quinone reductase-like Zn-dependent oxidoreductase